MQPITTAVILAAGLRMRLRDTFSGKPKGLLSIGGVPLVERSIQLLMAHGIDDIIIVTGYLAEEYEALAEAYPIVRTVHNPFIGIMKMAVSTKWEKRLSSRFASFPI